MDALSAAASGATAGRSRDQRRVALMRSPHLKGLDGAAVAGPPEPLAGDEARWRVVLRFVPAARPDDKDPLPSALRPGQVRLLLDGVPDPRLIVEQVRRGAEGELTVVVRSLEPLSEDPHDVPVHRLELVGVPELDPKFSAASVRFAAEPPGGDALPRLVGRAGGGDAVTVDYLAKDYDSFRRLLLERMAFFAPSWQERNPSDPGVTLIEVLAYAADYLSYYQDAVAGEAYLDTARRRISLRRHARLLDERLQEGTAARVWVQVRVAGTGSEPLRLPAGTALLTSSARLPGAVAEDSREHRRALAEGALVFRTLGEARLHPRCNRFELHTWGAEDWTLEAGSTTATLVGHHPHLRAGDVLVFEKRLGVAFGGGVVTDPRERHAVRLAAPPRLAEDPLPEGGAAITEIRWFDADALPADFPVARSAGAVQHRDLTVVHGNLVLADHGDGADELLDPVPAEGPFAPVLSRRGLTYREIFRPAAARGEPAAAALHQARWRALPDLELVEFPPHAAPATLEEARRRMHPSLPRWRPCFDLLGSGRFARDFVVETDDDGHHHLRFGDGAFGRPPLPGSRLLARYRVGGGPRGNVGSHAVRHVVVGGELARRSAASTLTVEGADNQLPAAGGSHPVSAEQVRIYAPDRLHAADFQRRCVSEADTARLAAEHPEVLRAVARHRWDGTAHTAVVYLQRRDGRPVDDGFERRLRVQLEPCLLAGWQLALRGPRWVPLDVAVSVRLEPGVAVERVMRRFVEERLGRGERVLAPGDFGFGEPFYASRVTARIMDVPGVADVRVEALHRWGRPPAGELDAGRVAVGPLEIVRLDNDPDAPHHGIFRLHFQETGETADVETGEGR